MRLEVDLSVPGRPVSSARSHRASEASTRQTLPCDESTYICGWNRRESEESRFVRAPARAPPSDLEATGSFDCPPGLYALLSILLSNHSFGLCGRANRRC